MRASPQPQRHRPRNNAPRRPPDAPLPERWFDDRTPAWPDSAHGAPGLRADSDEPNAEPPPAEQVDHSDLPGMEVEELNSQSLFQQFFGAWPR